MTAALALLFYLAVLALVVGCFVYLHAHRGEGDREVILAATYPLRDLEEAFKYPAVLEGLEHTMSLQFTPGENGPEIVLWPEEVALFTFDLGPLGAIRFRRSALKADLQPGEVSDDQCSVVITGSRAEIARKISQILQEVYQVDDTKLVDVKTVFRWSAKRTRPVRLTGLTGVDREKRKSWMVALLLLYLLVFKAAVGSLCGHPGSGPGGEHRAVCETLDGLGLGKWRDPWTSLDSLFLLLALGGTVGYWKRYFAKRKPHGTPGSA
jgi:hypothetical protein